MTNQRTERLRPGPAPGRRGSGYRRGAWTWLCLVGLLAGTSQAWAAEVVEVRVGRHPDFTRIVFELDRAAGYRIERSDPSAKNSELIVSLEAGSIPRRIQSSKSFIEQVVVEPNGARSVARIRLARGGLKLKEMILASPPRIVLDVISEQDVATRVSATRTAAATTAKPTISPSTSPTPTIAKTEAPVRPVPATQPSATKPAASTTSAATPTLAANATARPGAAAKPPMPTLMPPSTPTPGTRLLATTAKSHPATSKPTLPSTTPSNLPSTPSSTPPPSAALPSDPFAAKPGEWNDGGASGGADGTDVGALAGTPGGPADGEPGASTAATDEPSKARPMMVKSSGDDEGGGLMTWALAGIGLAVVAFVGLAVARRRRASSDLDGDGDEQAASPFGDEEQDAMASSSESSNPFAALSRAGSVAAPAAAANTLTPPRALEMKQDKKPESSLFDDTEEKTMESMEVISRSQVNESLGGPPMMGGASDELQQMFREMQRRVAALESRIDELVDARDRLERQVAAQTEELRVQRAAIARTQRAVRNLARPEDAGDDEPTEPALRDPN